MSRVCSAALLLIAAAPAVGASPSLALTVSRAPSAAALPDAAFVGFSGVEASLDVMSAAAVGGGFEPRPSYARLMSLLGPGVNHRIGHFWASATGARPPGVPSSWIEVNASVAGRLSAALGAWDGRLTGNIGPVDRADATLAVATAGALVSALGGRLASVELANEPDISSFAGNYSGYVETLRVWVAGLAAAAGLPPRLVDAPVLADGVWWPHMPSFLAEFGPSMADFTQHRYALSACGNRSNTPEELMNASTTWVTANDTALLAAVAAAGVRFVLGEGNTVSCQGSPGVSDVFASALYAVEAMLNAAAVNITGYKFHGVGYAADAAYYQPVYYDVPSLQTPGWDVAQPRPMFLGLWAFTEAAPPGSVPLRADSTVTGTSAHLLPGWALRSPQGRVSVAALHKDGAAGPAAVTVTPAAPCSAGATAALVRLLAGPDGLGARAGCSYANQTFDGTTDGVPAGTRASEQVPCSAGAFSFAMPPASGAFLSYDEA